MRHMYLKPGTLLLLIAVPVYFCPAIIARARKHRNTLSIFMLNLFVGWTFAGWIAALVWACSASDRQPKPTGNSGFSLFRIISVPVLGSVLAFVLLVLISAKEPPPPGPPAPPDTTSLLPSNEWVACMDAHTAPPAAPGARPAAPRTRRADWAL
jgi:hypothetical protein